MKRKLFLLLLIIFIQVFIISCGNIGNKFNSIDLYPAYEREGNTKKWGYINQEGDFSIDPIYDLTTSFNDNGLGKVYKRNKVGLIDTNGKEVVALEYDELNIANDNMFTAVKDDKSFIFDLKGNELFSSSEYRSIGSYSEDAFIVEKELENEVLGMGFIDKNGREIIEPLYEKVYNFKEGKAIVKEFDSKYAIINKSGKIIKNLDYNYIIPSKDEDEYLVVDDGNLYGYIDKDGELIIKPEFTIASSFEDGYARVSKSNLEKESKLWGVINREGEYIIKADYTNIVYLGEDLFAVAKDKVTSAGSTNLTKHAIITKDGDLLTDYDYYSFGGLEKKIGDGIISAYNGQETFILDMEGEIVKDVPKIIGNAEVSFNRNTIEVSIDNRLFYYNKSNKLVWQEDNSFILDNGGLAKERRYSPSNELTIFYPKLEELKNQELEEKINQELYNKFIKEPIEVIKDKKNSNRILKVVYSLSSKDDILIIRKSSYEHITGTTNGISKEDIYHINLDEGIFYNLKDLFKNNSNYIEKINEILKEKMISKNKENPEKYNLDKFESINEDQNFTMGNEELKIYFYSGELTEEEQTVSNITIPYKEIESIIDKDSKLWSSIVGNKGN